MGKGHLQLADQPINYHSTVSENWGNAQIIQNQTVLVLKPMVTSGPPFEETQDKYIYIYMYINHTDQNINHTDQNVCTQHICLTTRFPQLFALKNTLFFVQWDLNFRTQSSDPNPTASPVPKISMRTNSGEAQFPSVSLRRWPLSS